MIKISFINYHIIITFTKKWKICKNLDFYDCETVKILQILMPQTLCV